MTSIPIEKVVGMSMWERGKGMGKGDEKETQVAMQELSYVVTVTDTMKETFEFSYTQEGDHSAVTLAL